MSVPTAMSVPEMIANYQILRYQSLRHSYLERASIYVLFDLEKEAGCNYQNEGCPFG